MPYENLLRAVSLTLQAEEQVRRVDDPGLVIQMLVLKLAELPRLRDIEAAIAGAPGGSSRTAGPAPAPPLPPRPSEAGPRIVSLVSVEPEPEERVERRRAAGRRPDRPFPRDPRLASGA